MSKSRHDDRDAARRHPLVTRLLGERVVLGLTRRDVAGMSGIHRNTLETIESGKRGPSLHTFDAYARGMGYLLTLQPIEESGVRECPWCSLRRPKDKMGGHILTAHHDMLPLEPPAVGNKPERVTGP